MYGSEASGTARISAGDGEILVVGLLGGPPAKVWKFAKDFRKLQKLYQKFDFQKVKKTALNFRAFWGKTQGLANIWERFENFEKFLKKIQKIYYFHKLSKMV